MPRKPGDTNFSPREKEMLAKIERLTKQLQEQGKRKK